MPDVATQWYHVLDLDELPEDRVKAVVAGHKSLALTHYQDQYGALDNRCPHQGGPLGEGSIENDLLRCPWHGWDYCPLTGAPPGALAVDDALETFPVDVRSDGVYVGLDIEQPHIRTVSDGMVETMVTWGVTHVFGMVGHSNLGMADAKRRQETQGIDSASVFTTMTRHVPANVWPTSLHNPDFSKYAENCGGLDIRVTKNEELDEAITRALAYQGPALVEIIADPELI